MEANLHPNSTLYSKETESPMQNTHRIHVFTILKIAYSVSRLVEQILKKWATHGVSTVVTNTQLVNLKCVVSHCSVEYFFESMGTLYKKWPPSACAYLLKH
jgi:hypothetical protein